MTVWTYEDAQKLREIFLKLEREYMAEQPKPVTEKGLEEAAFSAARIAGFFSGFEVIRNLASYAPEKLNQPDFIDMGNPIPTEDKK